VILKRGVIFQLIAFAVITVVGVAIVSVNYIGLGRDLLGKEYVAYVDLTDSGGVFTNAEVTYRGVPVGRVGPIELTKSGIRVKLVLERGERIPRDGTKAVVANRSAVGEQYIDLEPTKKSGPYLDQGDPYTIPKERTTLPVSTAELLRNVDSLVGSVNTKDLGTIVDELDKAFSGSAEDLQSILDDTDRLLKTAEQAYPDTKQLLDNSVTVLDTQRGQATNIRGFARNLNEPTIAHFLVPEAAGHMQAAVAGAAEHVLALCADYVRPYFEQAQRQRTLRPDIEVEGTVEFLFRIITSLIVMDRDRDADGLRRFLRTYVVPVLAAP
jgi:phospholipid/cholesterol/gamma-HCH transport system substrate-binding protein